MATQATVTRATAKTLAGFRLIPRLETFPALVSFVQTPLGKITLMVAFGLGMRYFSVTLISTLPFGLITFMPEYRRFILAITPIALAVQQNINNPFLLGVTLTVVAFGALMYWFVMLWPKSLFGRRPIVFLLSGLSILICLACAATLHSRTYIILWSAVEVVASYVWFIAYALSDRNSVPANDLTLELATFRPFWGSTQTPFPKGAAYLRRIEAQNPEQLAIVQLKGLKLLAWAILLSAFSDLWARFFHGYLQIPTSLQALGMSVHGTPVAWHLRWESLILAFFEITLSISIFGHRFIASCRMAGYNALRNTYRPLSSTTIAEFFNRFYYYFKELLVDFFFYPAFVRYWKRNLRLRITFATFAAAFFGNAFYHFTRDWQIIRDNGLWRALGNYQVYLFYSFILASGLSISNLRKRGPRPAGFFRGRLVPTFGVVLFYCLLDVFGSTERNYSLIDHLRYLASLFFIRL